jgi:predicted aldo/keto reductase-like oxidoreductase
MLYRKIGKTGVEVSVLGFGCMRLPILNGNVEQIDEKLATEMIEYAIDNGVNYFDTAFPYHSSAFTKGGMSEVFVGKALKNHRNKINLATKLPTWLLNSSDDMDRLLDLQLERLQTDHIDFYLLHRLQVSTWDIVKKYNAFKFLEAAIGDGRIKYAGFSFHDEFPIFKEIVDAYDWSFCQIQYNYMDENYQAGKAGLKYAGDKGIGVIIMEPLRGGGLANNVPPDIEKVWDKAVIKRSPVEWALRFIWNNPEVSTVLSGMTQMQHVVDNVQFANEGYADSLTKQELEIIDEVKSIYQTRYKVNCTACQYCMPCPKGVNIPVNFSHLNNLALYKNTTMAKYQYDIFVSDPQKAKSCVECGKCEEKCPQNIAIRESLKEVAKTFS